MSPALRPALPLLLAALACGSPDAEGAADLERPGRLDAPSLGGERSCVGRAELDRDGDGWSDAVEAAVGTSPSDRADNPTARNLHVVLVPYERDPIGSAELRASPRIARADVAILLDTTGSMAGTVSRLSGQLGPFFSAISSLVDDAAIGLAGYGDFPVYDGANSHHDVPFYLVHRVMTVRTAAGMSSLVSASGARAVSDGPGPWFRFMRGGDGPEQGWEALRQAMTGVGIAYPHAIPGGFAGVSRVPQFSPASAHPSSPPPGEEVGTRGGMGFRDDATPIVVVISDTNNHVASTPGTEPPSATREVALAALRAAHARVIGIMAWKTEGHDDLAWIADATGAKVAPDAWGVGDRRPSNCPEGRCCVIAEDRESPSTPIVQPAPVAGACPLVFQSDRYDSKLATMLAQAIAGLTNGARMRIRAELRDDATDGVDVSRDFVERIAPSRAPGTPCASLALEGDAFESVVASDTVCYALTPKRNRTVRPRDVAQRFDAKLVLRADGVASLRALDVAFVVPPEGDCTAPSTAPSDVDVR